MDYLTVFCFFLFVAAFEMLFGAAMRSTNSCRFYSTSQVIKLLTGGVASVLEG